MLALPCKNKDKEVLISGMRDHTSGQVVIVGGGIAGLITARLLSENGIPFAIIERSARLGGHTKDWACMATDKCNRCHSCAVFDYEDLVASSPNGEILLRHELFSVTRSKSGLHSVGIRNLDSGAERELQSMALVLAVGFETFDPTEKGFWGYGTFEGVMTLSDLNSLMRLDELNKLRPDNEKPLNLAFFQCVGSRDKAIGANYCSQYCCAAAIRAALRILHKYPDSKIAIFYIDLQISGKAARTLVDQAQEMGVRFLQGVPGEIQPSEDGELKVIVERNGRNVVERFNRIVLSTGQRPSSSASAISSMTEAPLNEFGFFQTRSQLDLARSPLDRIYIAGSCSGPANIPDVAMNAGKVVSAIIRDLELAI